MYLEQMKNNFEYKKIGTNNIHSRNKSLYTWNKAYTYGTNIMIYKYKLKSRINSYMSETNHVYSWT